MVNIFQMLQKMRYIGLVLCLFLCAFAANAQDDITDITIRTSFSPQARYKGGWEALKAFIKKNVVYPKSDEPITGNVIVKFVIDTEGNTVEVGVVQSLFTAFDTEVLRVIRLFPKWEPAKENGKPVSVYNELSIPYSPPLPKVEKTSSPTEALVGLEIKSQTLVVDDKIIGSLGEPIHLKYWEALDKNTFQKVKILTPKESARLFGKKAKDGAIVITTKK